MATSREVIAASLDLKRLFDDGFEVVVKDAHLLVSNIPHLDSKGEVCRGTLIMPLNLVDDLVTRAPKDHTAYWAGAYPHYADKQPIAGIVHSVKDYPLCKGVVAKMMFSSKPTPADPDFDQKVRRYVDELSGPVKLVQPGLNAQTRRIVESTDDDSPFVFPDTNSARAQITSISDKLSGQLIAIVGLGGTGSYILDFTAKTPVKEIHLFDDDEFSLHNSFRAPSAPTRDQLRARMPKVEYLAGIYSKMHKGIHPHAERVTAANCAKLANMSFVFLSMDPGPDKEHLVQFLVASKIPFVDTGIWVESVDNKLLGQVNTIAVTPEYNASASKVPVKAGGADDLYLSNIQIAELNALNAVNAVIRWKKHFGFYVNERNEHESTYSVGPNMLTNEEINAPVRREIAGAA
jgi:hypothetical protein